VLYKDGISEAIRIIQTSPVPITIVEIAPATNIEVLKIYKYKKLNRIQIDNAVNRQLNCKQHNNQGDEWELQSLYSKQQYVDGLFIIFYLTSLLPSLLSFSFFFPLTVSCPEPNVQQNITASQAVRKSFVSLSLSFLLLLNFAYLKFNNKHNLILFIYIFILFYFIFQMYSANWIAMYTTPQDTCTWDVLNGVLYQTLRMGNDSYHPVLQVAFEVCTESRRRGGRRERREGERERRESREMREGRGGEM
jgi:hypothetical protein